MPSEELAPKLATVERDAIVAALNEWKDRTRAAVALGMSTTTLWRKMQRHGIRRVGDAYAAAKKGKR